MTWQPLDWASANRRFDLMTGIRPLMLNTHPCHTWDLDAATGPRALRIQHHMGHLQLRDLRFETNHFVAPEADILIIEGDLILDAGLVVDQSDVGTSGVLWVTGDLTAQHLFLTQQFELVVGGDIRVSGIVHGWESSTGGLRCGRTLHAGAVLLDRFGLNVRQLAAPSAIARDVDEAPSDEWLTTSTPAEAVSLVRDDELGFLRLPEDLDLDSITDTAQLEPYAVLTQAALEDIGSGQFTLVDVLQRHGLAGLRLDLLTP